MMERDDHRVLANIQALWHQHEDAPGMVYWQPRGLALYEQLVNVAKRRLHLEGYQEVRSPQLMRRPVWEKSGHWEHFKGGMFYVSDEHLEAALKPVSCPAHAQLFQRSAPSYRELPMRLAEFGLVHRDEPSGSLQGLLRLRQFTQDDGHIFCHRMITCLSMGKKSFEVFISIGLSTSEIGQGPHVNSVIHMMMGNKDSLEIP